MEKKKTGPKKGDPRCRENGKLGGDAVAKARGREFYVAIGKKGGKKLLENRGKEFFSDIGKKGGNAKKKPRQ